MVSGLFKRPTAPAVTGILTSKSESSVVGKSWEKLLHLKSGDLNKHKTLISWLVKIDVALVDVRLVQPSLSGPSLLRCTSECLCGNNDHTPILGSVSICTEANVLR